MTIARALARLDAGLLAVTLLGTGQDHDDVRRMLADRDDVTWHDWVPIEELPAVVAEHDVCLGIFGDTDKALTVVPTKVYQGAAAGVRWSPATPLRTAAPGRRGRARAARPTTPRWPARCGARRRPAASSRLRKPAAARARGLHTRRSPCAAGRRLRTARPGRRRSPPRRRDVMSRCWRRRACRL